MNEQYLVGEIVDQYMAFLDGGATEPKLDGLSPSARRLVAQHLADLRALHGQLVPDRVELEADNDTVWHRMGFDRDGTTIEIDGRKLSTARKAAGITIQQLVVFARNGGAQLSVADLFRMEQATSTSASQPDASALIAALGVSLDQLESSTPASDLMRVFLDSDEFYRVIDEWSAIHGRDAQETVALSRKQLLKTNYRAQDVNTAQLVELLRAVLAKLES
jgi:hypothetical protein